MCCPFIIIAKARFIGEIVGQLSVALSKVDVITNQFISTAWFSEQEKYRDLYETNKKMTEWMLMNFDNMVFE